MTGESDHCRRLSFLEKMGQVSLTYFAPSTNFERNPKFFIVELYNNNNDTVYIVALFLFLRNVMCINMN